MKKFAKSHHHTMSELNITPLLDLAFVLLVIFILATTPMVNDLDLNLPDPNASQKGPAKKPHLISIASDGKVFLNQRETDLAALRQSLEQMRREDKEMSVIVRGDSTAEYQNVISVLDVLQQADVTKVGIATETTVATSAPNPP